MNRLLEEYKRRLSEIKKSPLDQKSDFLEKKEDQLNCGIARLIDGYTQGYINEEEFKPRIKAMKQTLQMIGEQKKKIFDQKRLEQDLTLVVTTLEEFSSSVNSSLDNADWLTRRDIIRTLVKRIEINHEDVHIVFRVKELPDSFTHSGKADQSLLQHCCRSQTKITINDYNIISFPAKVNCSLFQCILQLQTLLIAQCLVRC
ncbi:hypothetical protein [Wolbachia endosymbiont (group A) of Lasioglossum fulvicorne]|uniref:hypothetical protein n=1 Tax=Wolbachia endosymbiont (group A) of Lasioglossum fulvicorne TaxID=3066201 RepID=UPI003341AA84